MHERRKWRLYIRTTVNHSVQYTTDRCFRRATVSLRDSGACNPRVAPTDSQVATDRLYDTSFHVENTYAHPLVISTDLSSWYVWIALFRGSSRKRQQPYACSVPPIGLRGMRCMVCQITKRSTFTVVQTETTIARVSMRRGQDATAIGLCGAK